ncbi:general stress protein [Saccharibacillus sp. CPCC 101409]|uniref:general stress protein n=1 Tax=Saccharibacillus sp. CPCC 101409 TaxID=3058041 RepID=UPI002672D6F6|nr:general stress protein [Saccharibacillus sp. CPCC 101409]MDO3412783.1 general stress protein [Saccharibacillus sp. CPCC 101409]
MDASQTKAYAKVVENGVQAVETIRELRMTGYTGDQLFVLAYDEEQTGRTAEAAGAQPILSEHEQSELTGTRWLRPTPDELRRRIEGMGFSEAESGYYEQQLEQGKVLVVALTSAV